MEDLVRLVSRRVGISENMARQAVDTVIVYLKDKLPAPLAGQIDGLLEDTGRANDPAATTKGLGNLLDEK